MTYLVVLKHSPSGSIEKYQDFDTRFEADAHVEKFVGQFPDAFIIDSPPSYASGYETVDPVAKTIVYASTQHTADTDMKQLELDMQETDSSCPRWFEDYVTENPVTLAPGRAKDSYDAKVALRAGRPV